MRHEDDGLAGAVEFGENLHDFEAGLFVEVAGGFVGEDDGRVVGECAGDGDALALAAGELRGARVVAAFEAEAVEEGFGACSHFAAACARVLHGEADVLEDGEVGEEVEGLEDHADGAVADAGGGVVGERGDGAAVDFVCACGGLDEEAEEVEHGRFAGARRPHHREKRAFRDGERRGAEGVDGDAAGGILLR